jgi:hypothetical protein
VYLRIGKQHQQQRQHRIAQHHPFHGQQPLDGLRLYLK